MSKFYAVWYFSSPALGSVCECEGQFTFEEALKWFKHHTSNVCAREGLTHRVIIVDADDYVVSEWKFGQGVTWPKEAQP